MRVMAGEEDVSKVSLVFPDELVYLGSETQAL